MTSADFYNRSGYLPSFKVFEEEQIDEVRAKFNEIEANIGPEAAAYSLHNIHMKEKWVLDLIANPNLVNQVKELLGPNVFLLDSRFICKYPSDDDGKPEKYVAWHQDMRYWGIDGHVVSAWVAIDDADVANGCMVVIPGTHTLGLLEHRTGTSQAGNLLTSDQAIPGHLYDATQSTPVPVKAGYSSLHHGHIVHGSEPNKSDRRRCGFVIRYVPSNGKPIEDPERPRKFMSTVLLSGENPEGNLVDYAPEWFKKSTEAA